MNTFSDNDIQLLVKGIISNVLPEKRNGLKSLEIPTHSASSTVESLGLPASLHEAISTPLPEDKVAVKSNSKTLEERTIKDLQAICKETNLKGYSGKNKADLITHIRNGGASADKPAEKSSKMTGKSDSQELEDKTVKDLQAICKERNLKGYSGKNKADLVTHIRNGGASADRPAEQSGKVTGKSDGQQLEDKTVKDLQAICKERNLKGYSGKNKADLITHIRNGASADKPTEKSATVPSEAKADSQELEDKTVKDLQAICKERSLKGYSGKNKADLITHIRNGASANKPTEEKLTEKSGKVPGEEEEKTLKDLQAICKEGTLKGYSGKNKADLITHIRNGGASAEKPTEEKPSKKIGKVPEELEQKTVKDLQAICKERSLKGYSGKNKADLITHIRNGVASA